MKNLVVCCDGTWNTPEQMDHGLPAPTNVVKLYNSLERDKGQVAYYHPGVGTGKGWWDRLVGGGTGDGLNRNIKSAYAWLARHYRSDDRIFLFGFSRGAYTARSLGGLISLQGLLDPGDIGDDHDELWARVDNVFSAYRNSNSIADAAGYAYHNTQPGADPKGTTEIYFIGVWDTVGALGIPEDFPLLGLIDGPEQYRFHDTSLSETVRNARHAVALDEKRASFAPTLWTRIDKRKDVKQLWFPGVHGDVGGGYAESGLSDGALKWMLDEAEACGLRIHAAARAQIKPDSQDFLHDSLSGVFKLLHTQPRAAPFVSKRAHADLHPSAKDRAVTPSLTQGNYWMSDKLGSPNSKTVDVFAAQHWNETGIFLESGRTYEFQATGQWIDKDDKFGPDGKPEHGFSLGDVVRMVSSAFGKAELLFEHLTHQQEADLWWTKRVEEDPWFALMGFIASEYGKDDRRLPTGETFMIGKGTTRTPERSGYLYCFANDAWRTYDNNRGSVVLTVVRV